MTKSGRMQALRFAVFALLLSATERVGVFALPGGAPTSACGTLTQSHGGISPVDCGTDCPFSVSLVAVDGEDVPSDTRTYKCGSLHTRETIELLATLSCLF